MAKLAVAVKKLAVAVAELAILLAGGPVDRRRDDPVGGVPVESGRRSLDPGAVARVQVGELGVRGVDVQPHDVAGVGARAQRQAAGHPVAAVEVEGRRLHPGVVRVARVIHVPLRRKAHRQAEPEAVAASEGEAGAEAESESESESESEAESASVSGGEAEPELAPAPAPAPTPDCAPPRVGAQRSAPTACNTLPAPRRKGGARQGTGPRGLD